MSPCSKLRMRFASSAAAETKKERAWGYRLPFLALICSMCTSLLKTTALQSHINKRGVLMRLSVAVAIACLAAAGLSAADTVQAAARKNTNIPAQGLGPALRTLAKDRGLQLVYVSTEVNSLSTRGATGDLTAEEALNQLLDGTGLTFKMFGDGAVGIVSSNAGSPAAANGGEPVGRNHGVALDAPQLWGQVQLAQAVISDTAPPAIADTAGAMETIDTIVVTGSRVRRSGFTTPTPVTVVESQDFETRATTNIADYLNDLPAFLPTQTPTTNTIGTGGVGNFLNLRGLGGERTLLLVDGRRHVPTTNVGTVSLNVIPALLIERVEVVTGGASAAYGSDAVAGVVNMIFDKSLEGFRGEIQSGVSERGDNEEWRVALAFGTSFAEGRGHFSIAAEGFDNDGIRYQRDRSWGARDWGIVLNPAYAPGNGEPQKLLLPDSGLSMATEGGLILSGSLAGMQFAPDGSLAPFNPGFFGGGLIAQGGEGPYAGSQAVLAVPLKRHNVFARGSYDITDNVTASFEASYAEQEASNHNLVQPFNFGDIFIRTDNAFLASEVRTRLLDAGEPGFAVSRLNTDFGFVEANDKVETRRAVAALSGRLSDRWTWDAYYQYGRTERENIDPGNVIRANMALALDAVIDPLSGQPVCRSGAPGCVPLSVLGLGAPSQAALDYIHGTARVFTQVEQDVVAASMQGTAFDGWAGAVAVAFGAEYRKDSVNTSVDNLSLNDGLLIGNQKPVQGQIEVKEAFTEVVLPLLADLPFAQRSELNVAARVYRLQHQRIGHDMEGGTVACIQRCDTAARDPLSRYPCPECVRAVQPIRHWLLARGRSGERRELGGAVHLVAQSGTAARRGGYHGVRRRAATFVRAPPAPVGGLFRHRIAGRDRATGAAGYSQPLHLRCERAV